MKACIKCGSEKQLSEFYKSGNYKGKQYYSAACKVCTRLSVKEYREANPEKARESKRKSIEKNKEHYLELYRKYYEENKITILEQQREYYQANRQRILEYAREYNEINRDIISQKKKKYYEENIEIFRYHRRKRKARVRDSGVDLSKEDYLAILEYFDYKCALTGSEEIHMDHFIPVASGFGETSIRNLIPLNEGLNLSKGSKNPFEWAKESGLIDTDAFKDLISYLADKNGLSEDEYEAHVYNCCEELEQEKIS